MKFLFDDDTFSFETLRTTVLETKGYPGRARMTRTARNKHTQLRLWHEAESLTGERYSL